MSMIIVVSIMSVKAIVKDGHPIDRDTGRCQAGPSLD